MTTSLTLHTLSRDEVLTHIDALADILENCVNGGAVRQLMLPFTHEKDVRILAWRRGKRWPPGAHRAGLCR